MVRNPIDDFDLLLQGLRSSEWIRRVDALRELTSALAIGSFRRNGETLLPIILEASHDQKWEVRNAAAAALAEICAIEGDAAESALVELTKDPNRWVSRAATRGLRRIPEKARRPRERTRVEDRQDPMLQYIVARIRDIGLRSLTPASIYDLATEAGEQFYHEFAADMAHEVRTLLTPIEGYIAEAGRRLDTSISSESARTCIDASLGRLKQLQRMIEDLQTYSLQSEPIFMAVDLDVIVRDALSVGAERVGYDTVSGLVRCKIDMPSKFVVDAMPGRLVRAFANIIANAYQAMPAGGKLVVRGRSREPTLIEISIEDTGHGMSPDVVERALKRFSTTRKDAGGTGLGLPIAQRIIENDHKGDLSLASVLGEGTVVTVQLPLRQNLKGV